MNDRASEMDTAQILNVFASVFEAEDSPSRPRSIKRGRRRTRAEMDNIRAAILSTIAGDAPMTCRQIFYRLVSQGVVGKTEAEYKSTVVRLLGEMRRAGVLPYGWIADNTRWMRKPQTWNSMKSMLARTAETYRRSLWLDQDAYVEVWLEKDALAGVLYQVTSRWDVPLMVTRGYPSITFLHSAAEEIAHSDRPTYLYYFGDHDPSGIDIPRKIESGLREFAPDAEIHFERVAVTLDQIDELDLPTRPTKKTDTRSKSFEGESVEADAIPPVTLRLMAERCIEQHIDDDVLATTKQIEQLERESLEEIAQSWEEATE